MSTSVREIKSIVRHHPTDLKYLFKSPVENRKRLTKIISNLVPYRVGIEFECFGAVGNYLIKDKKPNNERIKKVLGIYDFSEDEHTHNPNDGTQDASLNEVRVSFLGYKQLIPFYKTIMILNKCLIIPAEKGGIHIHIDAPFVKDNTDKAIKWFDRKIIQSEILRVFGGYKGTYNQRGADISKGYYVRIATTYNTIEFRIGHLTFDYDTIIRWVIECSKLVRRCATELGVKPVVMANPKKSKSSSTIRNGVYSITLDGLADQVISARTAVSSEVIDRLDRLEQENEAMRRFIANQATSSNSNHSGEYWTTYNGRSRYDSYYDSPF